MNKESLIIAAGVGIAGLALLSVSSNSDKGIGGVGGGGGGDDAGDTGDTIINFPELDLSNIWGDTSNTKKTSAAQKTLDTWAENWDLSPTADLGDVFRALPESTIIRSNILNPQPMPYSIYDTPKKASYTHHKATPLPTPESLGLTRKSNSGGSSYYRGPLPTASSHAALTKKNVLTKGYSF